MEIPIKCNRCGADLYGSINKKEELEIELCSDCEEAIKQEGFDEGYADAKMESAQDKL